MSVSTRTLNFVTDAVRAHRLAGGTRWRILSSHRQALMVLAHLRTGETHRDLAVGFGVGTTTAYRHLCEALQVLAALAPTLEQAIRVAATKVYVTLDGPLLRIDRVAMASKRDRIYCSGKHKAHGVNAQVIADPAGRLIWARPARGPARCRSCPRHGLPDALAAAGVTTFADTAYTGLGIHMRVPFRRVRHDRQTRKFVRRGWPPGTLEVSRSISAMRGPGERANVDLKNWRILRKIRSSPAHAGLLVDAIQAVIINS